MAPDSGATASAMRHLRATVAPCGRRSAPRARAGGPRVAGRRRARREAPRRGRGGRAEAERLAATGRRGAGHRPTQLRARRRPPLPGRARARALRGRAAPAHPSRPRTPRRPPASSRSTASPATATAPPARRSTTPRSSCASAASRTPRPCLDAVGEIAEPGTVLHSRTTAQRVIAYLVLEREADAGHAYAQAAAAVGSAFGWGERLADHVAMVHDEMTLVGGERDAVELLTHLRDAAAKAGDAEAERLRVSVGSPNAGQERQRRSRTRLVHAAASSPGTTGGRPPGPAPSRRRRRRTGAPGAYTVPGSSPPSRTLMASWSSGSRLKSAEPQSEQNPLSSPRRRGRTR